MLDTVTFVLHEVNRTEFSVSPDSINGKQYKHSFNRTLYERLCDYESKYIEKSMEFQDETVLLNPDGTQFDRKEVKRFGIVSRPGAVLINDDGAVRYFKNIRGKIQSPSSDYHVQFSISEITDAITFELSIPKWFFGHNVAQFVPQYSSKRFMAKPYLMTTFEHQASILLQRLNEFFYTFFDDLSYLFNLPSVMSLSKSLIEVKRLDFCYNQIFPSLAIKVDYLKAMRKIKAGRIRSNTKVVGDYDSAFAYRHSGDGDGFYYKMYDKGAEFLVNDFPRLIKENRDFVQEMPKEKKEILYAALIDIYKKHFPDDAKKMRDKDIFSEALKQYEMKAKAGEDLNFCFEIEAHLKFKPAFILQEAHKILRYEMSFTRKYMSTLYKREVFRKGDKHWKKFKEVYSLIKRYDLILATGNEAKAKHFKMRYLLGNKERHQYEVMHRSMNKKHSFRLLTSDSVKHHEAVFTDVHHFSISKNYRMGESDIATLSQDLMKVMLKKFKDEIDWWQIKEMQETKTVLDAIDDYNKNVEKRVKTYINAFGEASFKRLTHTQKRKKNLSKLNKMRIKSVVDRLNKGEPIKEICNDMGMSKSSYHSLVHDLKIFNIHKQSIKPEFNFKALRTDFMEYYKNFSVDKNYARKIFQSVNMAGFDTIRQNIT